MEKDIISVAKENLDTVWYRLKAIVDIALLIFSSFLNVYGMDGCLSRSTTFADGMPRKKLVRLAPNLL